MKFIFSKYLMNNKNMTVFDEFVHVGVSPTMEWTVVQVN